MSVFSIEVSAGVSVDFPFYVSVYVLADITVVITAELSRRHARLTFLKAPGINIPQKPSFRAAKYFPNLFQFI